jgi:hypothetical protein
MMSGRSSVMSNVQREPDFRQKKFVRSSWARVNVAKVIEF